MSDETVKVLAEYIANDILKQPKRALTPSTKLISTGLIDSFSLVDLAMFIEERFGVKIRDTELNAETFDTLDDLSRLIETRQVAGGSRR